MTTYSDSLKLALIGDGEQTNVWGATTNTNLGTLLEQAIVGVQSIAMTGSADRVLTNLNGASDEARNAVLIITGASSGGYSVILPAGQQKTYIVTNSLTSGSVTIKPSGGTAVTIPNGVTMTIYTNGTSTQAVNYVDVAGVASTVANLPGGAAGYIPYQSAPNTTSYLVPGTAGYVLTTAGAGLAPYWNPSGTATLASNLAGGLAGQVAYQTGPNTTGFTLAGSSGQFLTSNGTSPPTWTTFTGATQSGNNTFSGINSFTNATPVTFGVAPTVSGNSLITSSALTGYALLNGAVFTGNVNCTASSGFAALQSNNVGIGTSVNTISSTGSGNIFYFNVGGTFASVYFSTAGPFQISNSPNWSTVSDTNVKTNLHSITNAVDKLNALNPVHFEYKDKLGETQTGFIAQEFETVFPGHTVETEIPKKYKQYMPEGQKTIKALDLNLTAYLVKAIQELSAKVDAQAAEIATLKG